MSAATAVEASGFEAGRQRKDCIGVHRLRFADLADTNVLEIYDLVLIDDGHRQAGQVMGSGLHRCTVEQIAAEEQAKAAA